LYAWPSTNPEPSPAPPRPPEVVSSETRTWAALIHVAGLSSYVVPIPGAGILAPLIIWLARRDDSEFEDRHGSAAVNFQILCAVLYLGSLILTPVLIGIPLMLCTIALHFVCVIVATVKTAAGQEFSYPASLPVVSSRSLR
jgi:uncharacterized Tic20 family protein